MFIDVNSIKVKISGMDSFLSLGQYLVEAKYGYNKLWSSDSGRNLAGTQSGTLIGIFPKIILQFRSLNKTEFETIAPILDAPNQTIQYYDPNKRTTVEMATYTGDYEVTNKDVVDDEMPNEPFNCSFIAIRKRS